MNKSCIPMVLLGAMLTANVCPSAPRPDQLNGLDLGRHVFLTYCSGCHGFDGLAFYPAAPSFAMGDRLTKSDAELLRSIFNGRGAMPSWQGKLPEHWLEQALAYIRHMSRTRTASNPENRPEYYYIFAPSGSELRLHWHIPPP